MNQSGSRKNRTKKSGFMVGWSRFLRDLQREGRFDPARKRDTTFRKNVEEEEEEGREGSAIKFLRKLLFVPAPPLSPSPPYANICPTTENRNTYSRQINTSEQSEQRNGGVGRLPRRTKYGAKVEMELVKRHCQRCVLLPCALPNKKKGRKREKSKKIKNERQTAGVYRRTGKFLWDFLFFLFFLSLFFFVKKGKLNIFCPDDSSLTRATCVEILIRFALCFRDLQGNNISVIFKTDFEDMATLHVLWVTVCQIKKRKGIALVACRK